MLKDFLLNWYDSNKRSFLWRERIFKNTDEHAYHTWVCEVMSQQTLLSVLLPKYEQFLAELPNITALYMCNEEKLRFLWKGLGYYARARNLQKGATLIVNNHKGLFPTTQAEWQKIPGCGAYTSSIIASICYGEKIVAVDGNVIRVGSRLLDLQDASVWTPKGQSIIFSFLQKHICAKRPGDFNQALMDLGATVCKKYDVNCVACPLNSFCLAYKNKTTHLCPPIKPRRAHITENLYAIIVRNQKHPTQIGVIERTKGFLKKTIGFPLDAKNNNFIFDDMYAAAKKFDIKIKILKHTFKHSITHHNIIGSVVVIEMDNLLSQNFLQNYDLLNDIQWVEQSKIKNILSSSLDQKAYKLFLASES